MERDLSLFMDHTDKHIVDEVKRLHPSWITEDGFCPKCLEYFKRAVRDQGTVAAAEALVETNIGPEEIRQRLALGMLGFGFAVLVLFWLETHVVPRITKLVLFPLLFAGFLGVFQARKKFCVVIAQKQTIAMRKRASKILILSFILAALLTAGSFLI